MKWSLFPSCFDSRSVSWLPPLLFASLVQLSSSFLDTKSQWLKVFICIFISYPNPGASLWFWSQISAKNFKWWNHQSIYHVIWVSKQLTRDRWYLLAIFGTGESLLICVIQLRILAIRLGFLIKTRTLLVWAPNHPMKIWKGVFLLRWVWWLWVWWTSNHFYRFLFWGEGKKIKICHIFF